MWRLLVTTLRLASLMVVAGCVSLHTPLSKDEGYPTSWGTIVPLGPECKFINGKYENHGTLAVTAQSAKPIHLTSVVGLSEPVSRLSLTVNTHKVDKNGDTISTLNVIDVDNVAAGRELKACYCLKQTLMCKVSEVSRAVPYVSIGGSQRNVYFALAQDGSLIAKLQDYHIDVVFVVPLFGMSEPWARFLRIDE